MSRHGGDSLTGLEHAAAYGRYRGLRVLGEPKLRIASEVSEVMISPQ